MKSKSSTKTVAENAYSMRLFWDEEGAAWVAEVTDLPGCVGVADSPALAVEVAQGFIEGWIEDATEAGEDVPAPTVRPQASGRFLVRAPRSLHGRLQRLADDEGVSLNQLVVSILSEGVAGRQIEKAASEIVHSVQQSASAIEGPDISWGGWFADSPGGFRVMNVQALKVYVAQSPEETTDLGRYTGLESPSNWELENVS